MPTSSKIRVLGVMTGTSCDALDASCLEFDGSGEAGFRVVWQKSKAYPAALRQRVLDFQKAESRHLVREILELNRDLGKWYGSALSSLIRGLPEEQRPHLIANHGQTVAHFPKSEVTLQLGDATRIAQATGLTVAALFRDGDMAAKGQGAPLLPLYHRILAEKLAPGLAGVAIHNIGGISNLTYIGPGGKILAFDTGPGNALIDAAAAKVSRGKLKMDLDGKLSLKGKPDPKALKALLAHPYFKEVPPKSTGRDDFTLEYFFSKTKHLSFTSPDLVATATALTVESIASAYDRFVLKKGLPLERIYICGGGARNPTLLRGLQERLPKVRFDSLEAAGIDPQFIEAQGFALFGYRALLGKPVGGAWTGVRGFGPPAHLVPGENWDQLRAFGLS